MRLQAVVCAWKEHNLQCDKGRIPMAGKHRHVWYHVLEQFQTQSTDLYSNAKDSNSNSHEHRFL